MNVLLSWIGSNDLDSLTNGQQGPVRALLDSEWGNSFDKIHILYNNFRSDDTEKYLNSLQSDYPEIVVHLAPFNDPSDYRLIYDFVLNILQSIEAESSSIVKWHFHTSPGTSQMAAVWILLGKTTYPAVLYKSYFDKDSKIQSVTIADIPFNIDIEYLPKANKKASAILKQDFNNLPGFKDIIFSDSAMQNELERAYRYAKFDIPVLILGETGSGKELFARAIAEHSGRDIKKFYTLNCAALQDSVARATLFGYSKGAFTGADKEKSGIFEEYNGGIIFLDEIGDLSLEMQTAILRVVEYAEIQRVGDGKIIKNIDIRIIAATHKNIVEMITEGKFREDLFNRINVGVINIPSLKQRGKDIIILADKLLDKINEAFKSVPGYYEKKLDNPSKMLLLNYSWPGNVRELQNTLKRAAIWSDSKILTEKELQSAIIRIESKRDSMPVEIGVNGTILKDVFTEIEYAYCKAALIKSKGNQAEAGRLLGEGEKFFATTILKKYPDLKSFAKTRGK